jgi:predicted DNA-binding transcriptional regulator AlpA
MRLTENGNRNGRNVVDNLARRVRLADLDPWLSKGEVALFRNVSISTLDRQIARGLFPRGQLISARRRGWRLSTVRAAPLLPDPWTRCPGGGRET